MGTTVISIKMKKSIGGLKNPPPVIKGLYLVSLLLDLAAVVLAYWKVVSFCAHDFNVRINIKSLQPSSIRIKKYPIMGW